MNGKMSFKNKAGTVLAVNSTAGISTMQSRVCCDTFTTMELFSYKILRIYYFIINMSFYYVLNLSNSYRCLESFDNVK